MLKDKILYSLLFLFNILVNASNSETSSSSVTGSSSESQTSSASPSISQTLTNLIPLSETPSLTCSISNTYYSILTNISEDTNSASLNDGQIAGIVVGATAGAAVVGANVYFLYKYIKK